ncbi:MAG TPA: hypothetical protein PKI05_14840 [Thermogutta sp.]|nr:hypothetical protein [Thermogutta sp.]
MSYDDRAIVTGDEKEDTVALKPVSAGAEGQGGKPMDPHAEAARDTAQSTAPAVRHLRVDGAKHPPGGLSQNLMWLIFSRIGVPLLMLAGAVLLLQKARLWFRPPLEMPQIIQDIRSDGAARWRAVAQIGAIMADGRYPEVRSDRELAMAMSDAFREELQRPLLSVSDLSVVSRKYLCFLLWQMDDESVILALCEGATWWGISMPQPGSPVRCAALEGLCEMASGLARRSSGRVRRSCLHCVKRPGIRLIRSGRMRHSPWDCTAVLADVKHWKGSSMIPHGMFVTAQPLG